MLVWTWNGWPDPIVDFGRELYVPWQITQGKVLYRDIAYFNGPLSPYFNALLFKVLGVSLRTIVLANIAIGIAMVVMIWRLFRIAGDRLSATVACLLFITLFMTTQYVAIGNYNWITPYSHELTHGIALSLAALLALVARRFALTGFLVGLVFLTKPEVFLAITPTTLVAMLIARERSVRSLAMFAFGALVPIVVSSLLLGFRGTLGGWVYAFDSRITSLPFYRTSMGLDQPGSNLLKVALQFAEFATTFAVLAWLDRLLERFRLGRGQRITAAVGSAVVITFIYWYLDVGWHDAFCGLPLFLLVAGIVLLVILRPRVLAMRSTVQLMLISFALLLTLKLILAVRLYHYGFALAMPAMLVSAALFVSWLPRALKIRPALITRACAIGVLCLIVFIYLRAYGQIYSHKPITVAQGSADTFRADATGEVVNQVVARLSPLPENTTVAVVPQGVMINYLAGKANPTPYFTLMPPEVLMFGDDAIAAAYEKSPPDVLVIIPADLREYGYNSFDEVAPRTSAFFRANYQPIETITPRPGLPPATILRRVLNSTTRPR